MLHKDPRGKNLITFLSDFHRSNNDSKTKNTNIHTQKRCIYAEAQLLYRIFLNFLIVVRCAHTMSLFLYVKESRVRDFKTTFDKFYFNINYLTLSFHLQLITVSEEVVNLRIKWATGYLARCRLKITEIDLTIEFVDEPVN